MKLIWTYNSNVKFDTIVGEHTPQREIILLNYYIHSINTAVKFGYHTIIYCDVKLLPYFKDVAHEVIVVDEYENSPLWDSFKIRVLEERNDDFTLIDGDVILHDRLPKFTTDVIFDSYETTAFKHKYKDILIKLTKMGIKDVIDIWDNKQLPILSCGILYIGDSSLKKKYVHYWKLYNEFIIKHIDMVNIDLATMVGAQYLLSILSETNSHCKLSDLVSGDNPYYKHYCGPLKYNNPIVNTEHIMTNLKKKLF
jgi:hypothetical protein